MRLTKAETLEKLKEKVSIFEIPSFFILQFPNIKKIKILFIKKLQKI